MQFPTPDPQRDAEFAQLILKDKERRRDLSMYPEDTSNPSQRRRLPREVFVLLQFTILLIIIVGFVILYHLMH